MFEPILNDLGSSTPFLILELTVSRDLKILAETQVELPSSKDQS